MKKILLRNISASILLVFFLLLSGFTAKAETESGSITGTLVDDSTSAPVSFASVALLNAQDSSLLTGVITDKEGKFQFKDLPYGMYVIKATFVGYKPVNIKNIEITRQNKVVDLQQMKMVEDVKTINAAVVVGQRLKGEEKVDRTVFTLNDDVRKASTTALDALKHIPSVSVDFQNNVSLEGQSNIQFYVDGVLRTKEYVAQIKPDMIDKIELITNPGVRYDADVSGVINIVLRKEARRGMSGSVQVPIPSPGKIVAEPRANLEYGNQKFRFYVGDQMHYERFKGTEKITTHIDDVNGSPYQFIKNGKGINSWQNNYMNYGIDWFINEKSSLNFLGEWRNWNGISHGYLSDSKIYSGADLTEFLKTRKNSQDKSDNYYFSLFYKRTFKKEGNEIKAEVYFNNQTGRIRNEYSEAYIDPVDLTSTLSSIDRLDLTSNLRKNGELKLDLTFMLKNLRNEAGIRTYGAWINNNFSNNYTVEQVTKNMTDKFGYRETRQTAYYNLSGKVKKLSWQAGLRGEYSWLDINSKSNSDYVVLLPQASLNQSLPKDQSIKLSYRKQIFRPSVNSLNPFDVWTDSLHMRKGNPNLEPTIENRFELTYSKNFKANYLAPKLYLRYTTNGIQDNTTVTGEGVTVITQDNVGRNMEYGLGFNAAFQILKRWRFNGNFSVYNQIIHTNEAIAGHSREEIVSYRFNFSNILTLPKDYTVFMFANYGSPNISYQRKFTRQMLVLFGAEKKFSEKFSVDVMYNPFIRDFKYAKIETRTPGYFETWEGHVQVSQLFCFNLTYNFNRGNKISKIDRSVEYERNEGKGGM